ACSLHGDAGSGGSPHGALPDRVDGPQRAVGVFPKQVVDVPFVNIEQIDGWNPLEVRATQSLFMTFGRVRPGVTPSQASSELNSRSNARRHRRRGRGRKIREPG